MISFPFSLSKNPLNVNYDYVLMNKGLKMENKGYMFPLTGLVGVAKWKRELGSIVYKNHTSGITLRKTFRERKLLRG